MQQRKRRSGHSYSVYVAFYVSEEMKARVERHEEDFKQPAHITTQSFYMGGSQAQAERSFTRAAIVAMNNPLAFSVVMRRDGEVLVRVKVERS